MLRRIATTEDYEKKRKRTNAVTSIFLVGIMIFSVVGYAFYNTGSEESVGEVEYQDVSFSLQGDNLWHFNIGDSKFATAFNPLETKNISNIAYVDLSVLNGKPLYFSHDSEKMGVNEISRNLVRFTEGLRYACIDECEEDLPVKNCSEDNIIIIDSGTQNLINQKDSCIYISAKEGEILRVSDSFIFRALGFN